ncbi:MAG: 50S ribosomal protein L11 methyltransferase [Gemmatimonadaceae bacterium]
MSWVAVRVAGASEAARDAISAALIDAGAACVQEERDDLLTYIPRDAPLDAVRKVTEDAGAVLELRDAPDSEVDRPWPSTVGLSRAGRIVVAPPWLAVAARNDEIVIVIDPAMAFGTGEHPTTRGVLRLMQEVIRPGDRVADLGAGSAVLAIAAARLGAPRVAAIELDPDAIGNAEENVRANAVSDRVVVIEGDGATLLPHVAPVRVILANIISSVVETLLPHMRAALAPDGVSILSGILVDERAAFLRMLERERWQVDREDVEDVWWTVAVRPA